MSAKYWDGSAWRTVSLPGPAGPNVELRVSSGMLQWRSVGGSTWTDLADLSTIGLSGMPAVKHDADASVARPAGAVAVYWIGSVKPTNMLDYDLWYQT